jgi:hypothetical protein
VTYFKNHIFFTDSDPAVLWEAISAECSVRMGERILLEEFKDRALSAFRKEDPIGNLINHRIRTIHGQSSTTEAEEGDNEKNQTEGKKLFIIDRFYFISLRMSPILINIKCDSLTRHDFFIISNIYLQPTSRQCSWQSNQ